MLIQLSVLQHQGNFYFIFFAEKSHMPNVFSSPPAVEETGGDSWKYSLRVSKDTRNPHKQTHFFLLCQGSHVAQHYHYQT